MLLRPYAATAGLGKGALQCARMFRNWGESRFCCNTEVFAHSKKNWQPVGDSNPCDKTENLAS